MENEKTYPPVEPLLHNDAFCDAAPLEHASAVFYFMASSGVNFINVPVTDEVSCPDVLVLLLHITSKIIHRGSPRCQDIIQAMYRHHVPCFFHFVRHHFTSTNGSTMENYPNAEEHAILLSACCFDESVGYRFIKFLLDHGINPNQTASDHSGTTAIFFAVQYGYLDTVKLLVNRGANVHARSYGRTLLDVAASNGLLEVIMYLVTDLHMDINEVDSKGRTPLTFVGAAAIREAMIALGAVEKREAFCF